ncbi:hypothetical protein V8C42DRAFT_363409 [Trichoderma barbatum]
MAQRDQRISLVHRSSIDPASYRCSPPFSFPSRDLMTTFVVSPNDVRTAFCDAYECQKCSDSPEAAAVHQACYEIFMHECRAGDREVLHRRLLILALWRRPWREAQPLFLPSRLDRHALHGVAGLFGLPQLRELPDELLEMIRRYSANSPFWQSISALRMAKYVSDTIDETHKSKVVALRYVDSWERGGKLRKSETLPPSIRLTMDSDGINKIERLISYPQYSRDNYTHAAYIVGAGNSMAISEMEVELIDNHLRLKLPPDGTIPHIWNTPNPPSLLSCNMSPFEPSETWSRLFAVESDSTKDVSLGVQRNLIWLYLPIPEGDRLTVVGVRQQHDLPSCHLFQSEKAGDVIIGARGSSFRDDCLGRGSPLTFIYGEPNRGDMAPRVELVGAYFGTEPWATGDLLLPENFPIDKYEPSPITEGAFLQAVYFSWAPLDGVESTLIFRDENTGCCQGILFNYLNGGSRAIGECRLHFDPAQRVAAPTLLCVQTESRPTNWNRNLLLYRTRTTFHHSRQHDHHHHHEHKHEQRVGDGWSIDSEWKCYPMAGYDFEFEMMKGAR